MEFQNNIKYYREMRGLSQTELAKRMGYSSKSAISRAESQGDKIKNTTMQKYAKALNVPVEALIGVPTKEQNIEIGGIFADLSKDTDFLALADFYHKLNAKQKDLFFKNLNNFKEMIDFNKKN